MNFAFPAVFIFIIALPGILFRFGYRYGIAGGAISPGPIAQETAYGLVIAGLLHAGWVSLSRVVSYFSGVTVDFDTVLVLLTGTYDRNESVLSLLLHVDEYVTWILVYFGTLYLFSLWSGFQLHALVRRYSLDLRLPFFKYKNDWYYYLRGYEDVFPDEVDGVYASAVVDQAGTAYLYRGIIYDFFFRSDGDLDRLVLKAAHRRVLSDDTDRRYHDIAGQCLILRYSEIKTLNLDGVLLDTGKSAAYAEVPDN